MWVLQSDCVCAANARGRNRTKLEHCSGLIELCVGLSLYMGLYSVALWPRVMFVALIVTSLSSKKDTDKPMQLFSSHTQPHLTVDARKALVCGS